MVVSKVPVSQARPRENLLQYCVAQATEEGGGGGGGVARTFTSEQVTA